MMKTAHELFKLLPESAREKAIANAKAEGTLYYEYKDLFDAISGSFTWFETPEGAEYWSDITYEIYRKPIVILVEHLKARTGELSTLIIRYDELDEIAKSIHFSAFEGGIKWEKETI